MTNILTRNRSGRMSFIEGGVGDSILFLHGIPGSAHSWESVAQNLLAKHPGRFSVLLPDLLGFGESDVTGDDWFMEGQARALIEMLKHIRVTNLYLAAHDFGGPVALTLLRLFPELHVRGLILSATNLFTNTPIPLPLRSAGLPIIGDMVYGVMAGSRFGFRMMYQFAALNKKSVLWKDFRRHATRHGMTSTAKIFQHSLSDLSANYRAVESYAYQLTIPTLILWGDRDPFFPVSVGKRSASVIPNAMLKIYEATGHFVPEERAVEIASDIAEFF